MNQAWSDVQWIGLGFGTGLLLLINLTLSVALSAVASLSHVSLRRLAGEPERQLEFLERMKRPPSQHRAAAILIRQLSLLGLALLFVIGAREAGWAAPAALGIAIGAVVVVIVIELSVARGIALWNPRLALRVTAFSVRAAYALSFPLVQPLHALLVKVGGSQRLTDEEREEEQEEEVEALIEVGEREGLLETLEGQMMRGIVDLDETRVREIMTPRTDIVALSEQTTVEEARGCFLRAGHSRLPIFRGSIDHVVGVLHSRDLFRAWEDKQESGPVVRYMRSPSFVPESMSAAALLTEMRQRTHLSVVVDEYGGVAGLVTLEDLLEEIVGEIRDEHEAEEEELMRQDADGSYLISAATHVDELEQLFQVEFDDREFDTVGGLVVFGFGRVPSPGEILEISGLRVEVLEASRRRVHRVRIRAVDATDEVQASR